MRNEGIKGMLEWRAKHLDGAGNRRVYSEKGGNAGRGGTFRVACRVCNEGVSNPEAIIYTPVSGNTKVTTCKAGHRIICGNAAR
jgi:hypothetical protein